MINKDFRWNGGNRMCKIDFSASCQSENKELCEVWVTLYLDDYIYILSFQAKTTTVTEIKASMSILFQATSRKQSLVHIARRHKTTNFHISVFTFFMKAGINERTWLKLFLVHSSLWNEMLLYISHNSTIYHLFYEEVFQIVLNWLHAHVFGLWWVAGEPAEMLRRHSENIQTPHQKAACPESNKNLFCSEALLIVLLFKWKRCYEDEDILTSPCFQGVGLTAAGDVLTSPCCDPDWHWEK